MRLGLLLIAVACALGPVLYAGVGRVNSATIVFMLPNAMRSEGRLTLEYVSKKHKTTYEFAFSEVIDSDTKRSKISIGQPSYEPSYYYVRGDVIVSKNMKSSRYEQVTGVNWAHKLLPEFEWFLKLTYTDEELSQEWPAGKMGPSGIMEMIMKHQVCRNIPCSVHTASYSRTKASSILFENYIPDFEFLADVNHKDMNFFTIREIVRNVKENPDQLMGPEFDAILTLDYFSVERIDKKDPLQREQLERDLSMPMGEGVSEFFKPYLLDALSDSFMMTYEELSDPESQLTMLAYDHQFNYLLKESVGSSMSVWDLNEDLLYHVDLKSGVGEHANNTHNITMVALDECSVLSVEDENGAWQGDGSHESRRTSSNSFRLDRPYKTPGTTLKLAEFLGASRLVYMGRATVRELPCSLFETVLAEAPKIFQLNPVYSPLLKASSKSDEARNGSETKAANKGNEFDFIVQYFVREISPEHVGVVKDADQLDLINVHPLPARISLYRRHKPTTSVVLINSLEVHDMHLGLYGWTRKPSQLFMMPQCFHEQDEQLRISLQLDFGSTQTDIEDLKKLAQFKYKLEFDLMNDLFQNLELSRLHLIEYDFALERGGQVSASFVISDRMQAKRVSYLGEGELPKADSYASNRIELDAGQQLTAESCLMSASHLKDVTLVIHCPARGGDTAPEWPTCTAVLSEPQPVIKMSKVIHQTPCQAYMFEAREPPKSGVKSVEAHRRELESFEFSFTTGEGETLKEAHMFTGRVRDFEVKRAQQLLTISNYHFALPAEDCSKLSGYNNTELAESASDEGEKSSKGNVRHIGSIAYESVADCAHICNLDANCRSYSYCRRDRTEKPQQQQQQQKWDFSQTLTPLQAQNSVMDEQSEAFRCLLSSLDLRANAVDRQLMNALVNKTNNQIEVKDSDLAAKGNPLGVYKLEMVSGCNVYERDIMDMFTPTEELVRVDVGTLERVSSATSVSECARRVLALEAKGAYSSHVGALFAYCPQTRSCLLDENLFESVEAKGLADKNDDNDDENNDVNADGTKQAACELYRKRYQNYFHLTTEVVKRTSVEGEKPAHENIIHHVDLNLRTVEECAHACWQTYGHVCLSFDYCSPSLCSMNLVAEETASSSDVDASLIEYETRAGCLGYRRDLRLDQLRLEHLIGSQNPLRVQLRPAVHSRGRGLFLNLVLMCLSAILFAAGLLVGRVFNDRLEIATSSWRSSPSDGNAPAARPFSSSFGLRGRTNGTERLSTHSKFNIENEIYEDPDAIRMEDFGGQNTAGQQQEDDFGASELPVSPTPANKKQTDDFRRAGYMDVPDLL